MQKKQILCLLIAITLLACEDNTSPLHTKPTYFYTNLKEAEINYDSVNWLSKPERISGIIPINEISGICPSVNNDSNYWVHEDSKSEAKLQLLNVDGSIKGRYRFPGVGVTDLEDIAITKNVLTQKHELYIGDIGDNSLARSSIKVIIIPDAKLTTNNEISANSIKKVAIEYRTINNEQVSYNCEAMIVDPFSGNLFLFTKSAKSSIIYKVSYPFNYEDMNYALPIGEFLNSGNRVTAADLSTDGMQFILKTYEHIYHWQRYSLNEPLDSLFKRIPVELPYQAEVQGEAVCFSLNNEHYITVSEKASGIEPKLYFYSRKH